MYFCDNLYKSSLDGAVPEFQLPRDFLLPAKSDQLDGHLLSSNSSKSMSCRFYLTPDKGIRVFFAISWLACASRPLLGLLLAHGHQPFSFTRVPLRGVANRTGVGIALLSADSIFILLPLSTQDQILPLQFQNSLDWASRNVSFRSRLCYAEAGIAIFGRAPFSLHVEYYCGPRVHASNKSAQASAALAFE